MPNYNFYEKLLPWIHHYNDPKLVVKTLIDGAQEEYNLLREKALALPSFQDLDKVPGNLLSYLSYHLGMELETDDPEALRREQIRAAVPIYKVKGTDQGFVSLLRTLGFGVKVTHLFEDSPDSLITKDESNVVTGFNQRLPGWNAASKIRLAFYRLPEIENLEINGMVDGLLTPVLLRRILDKIKTITPIHIDTFVVFVWDFRDSLTMQDSLAMALIENDRLHLGSCCYHGKGAYIVGETFSFQYDKGFVWDDPAIHYDMLTNSSLTPMYDRHYAFYDTNYSYHWDYPEYIYNPACPQVWRVCCHRGEENAYNLARYGYTKTTGSDLQTTIGSNIVSSDTSLFLDLEKIEEGDFVNIAYEYWRIVSVIDNHTLELDRAVSFSGTFHFSIEWIDSWHRRNALHKDPMNFTLPAYIRDIMPTYKVQYDVSGFAYDIPNVYYDTTGQKHDGCGMEYIEIDESLLTALNSVWLEFAYYGGFAAGQINVPVFEIMGATSQFMMPSLGSIVGITITSNKPVIVGTITAKPTINQNPVGVTTLDVTLNNSMPEKTTAKVPFNSSGFRFNTGQSVGVVLNSDSEFENGDGDIAISLLVRLA
jgi:phage tail-like protein